MNGYVESLTALNDLDGGDARLWTLGDALVREVPLGASRTGFTEILDIAKDTGIALANGVSSESALRVIRDTAHHWPPEDRIAGLSFTAHRSANSVPQEEKRLLLEDLVKQYGMDGVTKRRVFDEVVARGYSNRESDTTVAGSEAARSLAEYEPAMLLDYLASRWGFRMDMFVDRYIATGEARHEMIEKFLTELGHAIAEHRELQVKRTGIHATTIATVEDDDVRPVRSILGMRGE